MIYCFQDFQRCFIKLLLCRGVSKVNNMDWKIESVSLLLLELCYTKKPGIQTILY